MKNLILTTMLLAASVTANASIITGQFTGGDAGEGLDFQGEFSYAVNTAGDGGFAIGDAFFTSDTTSGFSIIAENTHPEWKEIQEYGDSQNDNNLEYVMHSIRWGYSTEEFDTDVVSLGFENLIVGNEYSLQLLFGEKCCNRGFDVFANDQLLVNDFAPYTLQNVPVYDSETHNLEEEDIPTSNGAFIRYNFVAVSDTLNINLGGESPSNSDNNPIIHAATLEKINKTSNVGTVSVSEPASAFIFLPFMAFLFRRMRK